MFGLICTQIRNGQSVWKWLIAFKAAYFLLLSIVIVLWPTLDADNTARSSQQRGTRNPWLMFQDHFVSWDAREYLFLSEEGYNPGFKECAFYPLYPFLIGWISIITRGSDILIAIILSNFFSLMALVLFFGLTARRFGKVIAAQALALLLTFPGSLFFQFIYTESLFFLLFMGLCFALERECYVVAFISAFLLPLTRAVGIFAYSRSCGIGFLGFRRSGGGIWPDRRGGRRVSCALWSRRAAIC